MRTTFFVIGRELAAGHEFGNHSYSHGRLILLRHPWYRSRATSLAAVPALVDSLRARRDRVTTVGDLLPHGTLARR